MWLVCAGTVLGARVAAAVEKPLTSSHPPQPGDSEGSAASAPQYRTTHWTAENGLPQNSIKALVQTRDGYLWIGTLRGLARFDGIRFKVFDHNNTPEMTHDSINDLAVDEKDGGLWIGTGDGLLCYRDYRFERYGASKGLSGGVGTLSPAQRGGVWFSANYGQVGLARDGVVEDWKFGAHGPENFVRQITQEGPSRLLVLLGSISFKLYYLDLNTKSLLPFEGPRGQSQHSPVFRDAGGSLWLCSENGLWCGSGTNWTQMTRSDRVKGPWPDQVCRRSDGPTWVVTPQQDRTSLQRLVNGSVEKIPELPTEVKVTHLLEDGEGCLWVGTTTGLLRLAPKRLKVYSRREGLRNDDTQAVTHGADGTIWVGTGDGISRIKGGHVFDVRWPPPYGFSASVGVLLLDHEGTLWIARPGCVARFRQGLWEQLPGVSEIPNLAGPSALYEDRAGRVWVAASKGVCYQGDGQWRHPFTTNSLSHEDVRVIYQDRRGDMWFGSYGGGLIRMHNGQFTTYKTARGDFNNRAWWVHEDADGVFWVGSEDGLNRFVPPGVESKVRIETKGPRDQVMESEHRTSNVQRPTLNGGTEGPFSTFTTEQGLGENVVNNIQEDEFGFLWLSGLHGIYRISRQELNEVAAGKRAQVQCIAYGEADGMLNSECNGGDNQPAGCKDSEGRIWFPTAQGVVVIDPKQIHRNEVPPPVAIEQVKANDVVVFGDDVPRARSQPSTINYQLPAGGARVLEIRYTGNSLVAPEKVRFKYRLDGYDLEWREAGDRRVAFYTNLRPGDYRFEVMAANPHGVWSKGAATFDLSVAPHLWETWPFYIGMAASVLAVGFGLHHQRVKGLRRVQRLEQLRALHEERARIAKDLHDDLGANLTGVALQIDLVRSQRSLPDTAQTHLATIAGTTRGLVDNMREVVWAMNPKYDNVESLASFLGQYTENYLLAAGLRCRLELPPQVNDHPFNSHARHEVFLVVKEALHNIVRHAHATEVHLRIEQLNQVLQLVLSDNGRGLPPKDEQRRVRGLDNMQIRVADLGGQFSISSESNQGTRIKLVIPLDGAPQSKSEIRNKFK